MNYGFFVELPIWNIGVGANKRYPKPCSCWMTSLLDTVASENLSNSKKFNSCWTTTRFVFIFARNDCESILFSSSVFNLQSEHFPFLGNSVAVTEMRCRSMFYTSLGRLLMVDLGEDEEWFHTFMLPLTGALESLGQLMSAAETPVFAEEEAKKALIGLARDLRGLAYAFNTKTSYMMLFDWLYPFWHHWNKCGKKWTEFYAKKAFNLVILIAKWWLPQCLVYWKILFYIRVFSNL